MDGEKKGKTMSPGQVARLFRSVIIFLHKIQRKDRTFISPAMNKSNCLLVC